MISIKAGARRILAITFVLAALVASARADEAGGPLPRAACRLLSETAEVKYLETRRQVWADMKPFIGYLLDLSRLLSQDERTLAGSIADQVSYEMFTTLREIFEKKIDIVTHRICPRCTDICDAKEWVQIDHIDGRVWISAGEVINRNPLFYVHPVFKVELADLASLERMTAKVHESLDYWTARRLGVDPAKYDEIHGARDYARASSGAPAECFESAAASVSARSGAKRRFPVSGTESATRGSGSSAGAAR